MPLLDVRWVDSSVGIVAVLQSVVALTGFLVAGLVVIAVARRDDEPRRTVRQARVAC